MRSVFAALGLSLLAMGSAFAADPYTVSDVRIDASASNALEAQTEALRQGQMIAADILIERLTLFEDRFGTPLGDQPYTNSAGEIVEPGLADAIVAEMISGLEILNEQRSATRYLADLSVSFDPRAVGRVLTAYGVPYVEAQARPTLVLPVYDGAGGFQLWQDNPWRSAWLALESDNALTPLFAPEDDFAAPYITARGALGLDEAGLRQIGNFYSVNRIAVLRGQETDSGRRFGGYLVNLDNDEQLEVETWGPQTVYGDWNAAAAAFLADRENWWKQASVVRDTETEEFRVTVLYGGLPEWRRLQGALTGASLVSDARLDALSRDGALMTVNYRGERGQLISELAERGAALEEHPGIGWVIRSAF